MNKKGTIVQWKDVPIGGVDRGSIPLGTANNGV